jgi:hypothetical protein
MGRLELFALRENAFRSNADTVVRPLHTRHNPMRLYLPHVRMLVKSAF